jgi:peptidoglycan hydrolase-like protein with peptidoglycan-binding domain
MYATHYFEGFRVPTQMYTVDGKQVTGVVANELDYAGSLEKIAPTIFDALQGWDHPPMPVQYDLTTVTGVQSALTFLAGKYGGRWQKMDPQGVDGKLGPLTKAALLEFQNFMSIPATGQIDAQTVATLRTVLDRAQS